MVEDAIQANPVKDPSLLATVLVTDPHKFSLFEVSIGPKMFWISYQSKGLERVSEDAW